jgi:hypothetical protein
VLLDSLQRYSTSSRFVVDSGPEQKSGWASGVSCGHVTFALPPQGRLRPPSPPSRTTLFGCFRPPISRRGIDVFELVLSRHQAHHGAVAHFAPVCSSWVTINRGTSKRSPTNVLGGPRPHPYVRNANIMASRTAFLMLLAICLGLDVVLEQPGSSLMFQHPRFEQLILLTSSIGGIRKPLRLVSTFMGSFGAPTPKLTFLLGTPRWLPSLHRTVKLKTLRCQNKETQDVVKRRIDKHGRAVYTGSKARTRPDLCL